MKSYTDIEQSKKLAKFLPLKSADMDYIPVINIDGEYSISVNEWDNDHIIDEDWIPSWSLAALLNILESEIDGEDGKAYQLNIEKDGTWWNVWYREQYDEANPIETESTEELIDACYEMILKLHEQNLL